MGRGVDADISRILVEVQAEVAVASPTTIYDSAHDVEFVAQLTTTAILHKLRLTIKRTL